MKQRILKITFLSVLSLSFCAAIANGLRTQKAIEAEAYSTASLPTTIYLRDNTDQEIRNYYSGLNSLSMEERSGNNLLKNLKPILKNGQNYFSYDTDSNGKKIWQIYEISDRDWDKSPASSTTYGTYDESTNTIKNYQYGTSNTTVKNNPYIHALYINRNVDNQSKAWGNHNQDQWGINREHVWPKSQGFNADGAGGVRGDPMHLIAGNGYSNNKHNDHHYGYVDKTKSYIDCGSTYSNQTGNLLGVSKTTGAESVFEPQDCDKGDIARAVFYLVARYNYLSGSDSDGIDQDNPNLELVNYSAETSAYTSTTTQTGKMGIVQDLLEWNRIDPPDEYEIHRNNLLYNNYTKNRNPFIDFPEWAEYIWGKSYQGTYDSESTGAANPANDVVNSFATDATLRKLSSISVTTNPTKTTYEVGEDLDTTGLVVTATYSDSSTKVVTDYTLSEPDMSTTGEKTITVTYNGKTTTFTITVSKSLTSIYVDTNPTKVNYTVGDTFSSDGLVVKAKYSNDSEETITGYTLSTPDMSTAGEKIITVTYEDKTATFSIIVNNPGVTLSSIYVSSNPTKTTYYVGETFDSEGLVVKAKFSDDSEMAITSYTLSTPDMSTSGEKTITVTYQDKTTTFNITVEAISLTSIAVSGDYKTSFLRGETFSFGGVVTATYSNGSTKDVTDSATFSGYIMSEVGTHVVTVSYSEAGVTKTTTYQIIVEAPTLVKISVTTNPTKTTYEVGDELDTTGLVVTATYSDGSTEAIRNYTLSGYDKNKVGTQTITVTYQGKTATFVVIVNEKRPQEDPLKNEKEAAVAELLSYYTSLDLTKYTQENRDKLFGIYNSSEEAILAAQSIEEINQLLSSAKTAMDTIKKIEVQPANGGCGGNVIATSAILSGLALIGIVLLVIKRKKLD